MRAIDETEFRDYVAGHLQGVRRMAFLLCGDWHHAEDIAQMALTKVYLAWRRLKNRGALDGYVRQVVVRAYIDETRRGWRRERPSGSLPDGPSPDDFPEDRMRSHPGAGRGAISATRCAGAPLLGGPLGRGIRPGPGVLRGHGPELGRPRSHQSPRGAGPAGLSRRTRLNR